MPRQILFIQGAGETTHDQWDNRLVDSLRRELGEGYIILYPRMPNEADPRYPAWKSAMLDAFDTLEDGAILVGHSVGATVLLHTLADTQPRFRPAALMLIAPPFIGDGGWRSDDITARTDFSQSLPTGLPVWLYYGDDDQTIHFAHIQLYAKSMPQATIVHLRHRDHQLNNDLSEVARDIRSLTSRDLTA